ncbi:MAG: helix-turn-helix transcriptional regulator [Rhodomicrobium sp.]
MDDLKAMSKEERLEACRAYVNAVLETGDDLDLAFYPHWMSEGRTMFGRSYGYANNGKPGPKHHSDDFTLEELISVLEPLGKVHDLRKSMPWNFRENWNSAKDFPLSEAVGKRLKKAREALALDIETFYAPSGMTRKTALKWETGDIPSRFMTFGERRFEALSEAYGIPVEWLLCWDLLNWKAEAAEDVLAQPQAKAAS